MCDPADVQAQFDFESLESVWALSFKVSYKQYFNK